MRARAWPFAVVAFATMLPVTLPVAGLKQLVQDRFVLSVAETTWFMAINMVAAVLVAPIVGGLADRFGRRRGLAVIALLLDAACFVLMTRPLGYAGFLMLRFCEGACHIAALSWVLALAADHAPSQHRGRTMGMVAAALTLGVALGAPIGGVLAKRGVMLPFEIAAALLLLAAVLASLLLREVDIRGSRPGFREAFSLLKRHREMLAPLAFAFADRFTVGFFVTVFPLYAQHELGASPTRTGGLLAALLLPFALLSYPAGRLSERVSRSMLTAVGSVCYGALLCSLPFWPDSAVVVVMLVLGVLSASMFVPSMLLLIDVGPPDSRSTVLASFNAAGSLGFILGPLVGGATYALFALYGGELGGYRAAFVVAGASELVVVLASLPSLRRLVRAGRTT